MQRAVGVHRQVAAVGVRVALAGVVALVADRRVLLQDQAEVGVVQPAVRVLGDHGVAAGHHVGVDDQDQLGARRGAGR